MPQTVRLPTDHDEDEFHQQPSQHRRLPVPKKCFEIRLQHEGQANFSVARRAKQANRVDSSMQHNAATE